MMFTLVELFPNEAERENDCLSRGCRSAWSVVLARDYPEVVCGAAAAGSACVMYRLASVVRQCARCHKQYAVGLNTAAAFAVGLRIIQMVRSVFQ